MVRKNKKLEFGKEVAELWASRGPAEDLLQSKQQDVAVVRSFGYKHVFLLESKTTKLKMSKCKKLKMSESEKDVAE